MSGFSGLVRVALIVGLPPKSDWGSGGLTTAETSIHREKGPTFYQLLPPSLASGRVPGKQPG